LDTVVLLLVELIGSIVISLKFRLAIVASQMMRGQAPKYFFLEPPLVRRSIVRIRRRRWLLCLTSLSNDEPQIGTDRHAAVGDPHE